MIRTVISIALKRMWRIPDGPKRLGFIWDTTKRKFWNQNCQRDSIPTIFHKSSKEVNWNRKVDQVIESQAPEDGKRKELRSLEKHFWTPIVDLEGSFYCQEVEKIVDLYMNLRILISVGICKSRFWHSALVFPYYHDHFTLYLNPDLPKKRNQWILPILQVGLHSYFKLYSIIHDICGGWYLF